MTKLLILIGVTIMTMGVRLDDFTSIEFLCHCPEDCTQSMDSGLIIKLQVLRTNMGIPFLVNSAYRCPSYNKAVGGIKNSMHIKGKAVDISTKGWTSDERFNMVQEAMAVGFTGIGIYDDFIHLDVRSGLALWIGK